MNDELSSEGSRKDGEFVVLEGWIVKRGAVRKNWKRRYLTLSRSHLRYYARGEGALRKQWDVLKGQIPTEDIVELTRMDKFKKRDNCIAISVPSRTYFLTTATAAECDLWLSTLQRMFHFRPTACFSVLEATAASRWHVRGQSPDRTQARIESHPPDWSDADRSEITYSTSLTRIFSVVTTVEECGPSLQDSILDMPVTGTAPSAQPENGYIRYSKLVDEFRAFEDVVQPEAMEGEAVRTSSVAEQAEAIAHREHSLNLKLQRRAGVPHPDCMTALEAVATLYRRLGDYAKAVSYYERAVVEFQKMSASQRPHGVLADCHAGLGLCSIGSSSDYLRAIVHFEMALEAQQTQNQPQAVALCLRRLGDAYYSLGEFVTALSYYEQCSSICSAARPTDAAARAGAAETLACLGLTYLRIGDSVQGAELLQQYAATIQQTSVLQQCPLQMAAALQRLATASLITGNNSEAERYSEQSIQLFDEASPGDDIPYHVFADALNNRGVVAKRQGRLTLALQYFSRSLAIRHQGRCLCPHHPSIAGTQYNVGLCQALLGKSVEMVESSTGAQEKYLRAFGPDHHSSIRATLLASHYCA